jgi:hypothetical protein
MHKPMSKEGLLQYCAEIPFINIKLETSKRRTLYIDVLPVHCLAQYKKFHLVLNLMTIHFHLISSFGTQKR